MKQITLAISEAGEVWGLGVIESCFPVISRARNSPGESLSTGRIPEGNYRFGLLVYTRGDVLEY